MTSLLANLMPFYCNWLWCSTKCFIGSLCIHVKWLKDMGCCGPDGFPIFPQLLGEAGQELYQHHYSLICTTEHCPLLALITFPSCLSMRPPPVPATLKWWTSSKPMAQHLRHHGFQDFGLFYFHFRTRYYHLLAVPEDVQSLKAVHMLRHLIN